MSVLIKGMEMPQNCAECQFRQYEYCDLQRQDVYAVNIMDYAISLKRHPDCPLIELPPHGRLMDVSTVEEIRFHDADGYHVINGEQLCELEIDADTVIEAEGENDGR